LLGSTTWSAVPCMTKVGWVRSRCRPSGLNSIPAATWARQAGSEWGWANLAAARRRAILGRRRRVDGPSALLTNCRRLALSVRDGETANR
jgi:hypothetical protein